MSEIPNTTATVAQISKVCRNVDNAPITLEQKQKLQALLELFQKTWEEECVLPLAIVTNEEAQKKKNKGEKANADATKKNSFPSANSSIAPQSNSSAPQSQSSAGVNVVSPSEDDSKVEPITAISSASPTSGSYDVILDEEVFLSSLTPSKGKLQPVVENHAKPQNPLHLAAKIKKAYQGCLNTVLWRHQNLPQYWTEDEIRSCVRMRYMDWYGISSRKVDPATGATIEVPCAILHLRAQYSDVSISAETRCKYVLLALEKGVNYMRQQFHASQQKVLEKYAAARPNEPFRFADEKRTNSKKTPVTATAPGTMDSTALKVLTEEIQGIISEAQKQAAAAHGNLLPASEMVGEDELLEGSEQLIMVMDETDSTSDKMDTKFLRFIAPILFSHYVERLRYCIVINPTFISTMCVNIIKLVVDDRTKSKLKLMDVSPVPLDEWLAEKGLSYPGRQPLDEAQLQALKTPTASLTGSMSEKDREKREKEYLKEREKRAKKLSNEDQAYPSQEVVELLGVENTPIRFGGTLAPMSANQYESWFHAIPPFSNPSQRASEALRDERRAQHLK